MKTGRRLRLSLRALLAHRMRAVVAIASVAAGVAAVFVSAAVGKGAEDEVLTSIRTMGTNLLIVKPIEVKRLVARRTVRGFARTLTLDDYDAIARLEAVKQAAPGADASIKVKAGRQATVTTVRGTSPEFPVVRRYRIRTGRFFDDAEALAASRVAVLGARTEENLFGGGSGIGRTVSVRGVPFQVIGVLEAKGVMADGSDEDNQIVVPVRAAERRVFNSTWLTSVYVSVRDENRMDDAERAIRNLMRDRHRRGARNGPDGADDFAVQNTANTRAVEGQTARSLALLTTGLAALALLVGGIGILALMLLSVGERTGEIGLRMAVGATPRGVFVQFLIEAMLLAIGGWLVGVAAGGASALAIAFGTAWRVGVPGTVLLLSLAVAIAAGLLFGAVPAWKAARMPPIEALAVA